MQGDGRVAWREGLFLRQQHFQQQDRFIEAWAAAIAAYSRPHAWGVSELKINETLSAIGKFAVERLAGVTPDGLPFSIPENLPPPPPLDVPSANRNAIVYLTIPVRQPGATEFADRDPSKVQSERYLVDEVEVSDSFSIDREREPVSLATPNFSFGVSAEAIHGRSTIGLVRIQEVNNGSIVFDRDYIAPALDIRSSTRLLTFLDDIIGRVDQRVDELSIRAVEVADGGADLLSSLLLLLTLNRWSPPLKHFRSTPMIHPERLFESFVSLAGELSTSTRADRKPPEFAGYNHLDLQLTFEPVFKLLRDSLSTIFDRSAMQLELAAAGRPGGYRSTIADPGLYKTSIFFLAVIARVPLEQIRAEFPLLAKIGAVQRISDIVRGAIPGVPLQHVVSPPPQIRVLPGYVYFELDQNSEAWAELIRSTALGLFLNGEWPGVKLELWCVKSSSK